MEEIIGEVTTAISYAKTIDELAKQQIKRMCDNEFTSGSKIRIMPDVHAGKGCTIGTTMTILDKAVPNIVGVDIGCGMLTIKLEDSTIDFEKLDEAAHFIPSGKEVWEEKQVDFDLNSLNCYNQLKHIKRLENSIGSLGGGNHFIEVEKSKDGIYYLVIHSGSRNLGCQVAEHYQQLAMDLNVGNASYTEQREKIIRELKEAGRFKEIQTALDNLRDNRENTSIPKDLCFLYGKYFEQYLQDMKISQEFAIKNREQMAKVLLERAGLTAVESFHTVHNYIDIENMILRKGAIPAYKDQKVLIPINMRDGSVLAVGKGNADWNYSAPHGAGRIMSRTEARNKLKLEDYKEVMAGIYTTSINESTLIVDVMKPVYNFKASE